MFFKFKIISTLHSLKSVILTIIIVPQLPQFCVNVLSYKYIRFLTLVKCRQKSCLLVVIPGANVQHIYSFNSSSSLFNDESAPYGLFIFR